MNRRFTALVLVLSMLVCVFPVFAADEALPAQQTEPQYDTEAYELLKYLQIVELEPEALSGGITRGQFLKSLDILVGYGTYTSQEQLFSDMTPDDPYAPYINMLAKSGFIQGFPDGTIRLSSSITLEEATRLLLKAIGWDYFANANTTSGQYYSQAQSAELLDGVTAGWAETINGETYITLLYNALTADVAEQTSFGQDVQYTVTKGRNLLYTIFGIVHLEGVLEGVDLTRLMGENDISPWHVVIDGVEVEFETTDIYDALGCALSAYCTEQEDGSLKLALWMISDDNEETEIAIEDIVSIESGRLTADDNGKMRKYNYSSSVRVLYNGVSTGMLFSMSMFEGKEGAVRLIDNNRDGSYEVISVEAYKNYYVSDKDGEDSILYDASGDTTETIVLDTIVNDPYTIIYNDEGEEIKFSNVDNGAIVTVFESAQDAYQGYIRAYVSTQTMAGTIQEVADGGKFIMVNGTLYEVSARCKEKSGNVINAGVNVTLRMDIFGRIAMVEIAPSTNMQYGFVSKATLVTGIQSRVQFRVFTSAGIFTTLDAAEKVVIDGVTYEQDSSEILTVLNKAAAQLFGSASAEFRASLVRYRLDADGKIKVMDTVLHTDGTAGTRYNADDDAEDALFTVGGTKAERLQTGTPYWQLGASYFFDSTVPLFVYPATLEGMDDEESFEVAPATNGLIGGTQYTITGFSSNGNRMMVEAMGIKTSDRTYGAYASETKPAVVTKVTEALDNDGDVCYALSLLDNGGLAKAYADKDFTFNGLPNAADPTIQDPMTVDQLKPGDFLRYQVDGEGKLQDITLYYRADGDINIGDLTTRNEYGGSIRKGYILEKYADGALVCYTDDIADLENPDLSTCELIPAENTRAAYYRYTPAEPGSSKTEPRIDSGSYASLKSYRTAGENCSRVLIHAVYLIPHTIYMIEQ